MIDLFKLEEEMRDLIMEFQANKEKIRNGGTGTCFTNNRSQQ